MIDRVSYGQPVKQEGYCLRCQRWVPAFGQQVIRYRLHPTTPADRDVCPGSALPVLAEHVRAAQPPRPRFTIYLPDDDGREAA